MQFWLFFKFLETLLWMTFFIAFWSQLGPTCTQLGPNLAPTWPQLGPNLAPTWPQLGPTWPNLAPTWANLASTWPLSWLKLPNLVPTWLQIWLTWPHMAFSWDQLGPNLAYFQLGANLEPIRVHLGTFFSPEAFATRLGGKRCKHKVAG